MITRTGCSVSLVLFLLSSSSFGQSDAPESPEAPKATTQSPEESDGDDESTEDPEETPAQTSEEPSEKQTNQTDDVRRQIAAMQKSHAAQMAELEARLTEVETAREEAEIAALTAQEEQAANEDVLAIYGFIDVGLQRYWVDERSFLNSFFETNTTTFLLGAVDFYFDVNPHPDWRGLAEIRFTNAPHGEVVSPEGFGEEFERTNTFQFDPHGTALNAPIWGGYTVIERAWLEWNRHEAFRVRAGSFFTPFGIWNIDHGTPTLIALALPQFIQQRFMPLRQTGVQALGSFFFGDLEFGYRAWLTNGRTDSATSISRTTRRLVPAPSCTR